MLRYAFVSTTSLNRMLSATMGICHPPAAICRRCFRNGTTPRSLPNNPGSPSSETQQPGLEHLQLVNMCHSGVKLQERSVRKGRTYREATCYPNPGKSSLLTEVLANSDPSLPSTSRPQCGVRKSIGIPNGRQGIWLLLTKANAYLPYLRCHKVALSSE